MTFSLRMSISYQSMLFCLPLGSCVSNCLFNMGGIGGEEGKIALKNAGVDLFYAFSDVFVRFIG